MKKAVVVGLGSMGKRRIRLMKQFFPDIDIVGVDSREDRREQTNELFGIATYDDLGKACRDFSPDMGLVCTSPLSHAALVGAMLEHKLDVFCEIDLVSDGIEANAAKAKVLGKTLFFSSTPLYRNEIRLMSDYAAASKHTLRYRYHIGQYLPDWHPWEGMDFFVAQQKTNGCREIIAIELPWLTKAFGNIVDVKSNASSISALNLAYPDCYFVTLTHESGAVGQLAVDVVSRKAVRDLELYSEDLWLHWGGSPSSLSVYDIENKCEKNIATYVDAMHDERYSDNIVENAYVEELRDFFAVVEGSAPLIYDAGQNLETLRIADLIEGI